MAHTGPSFDVPHPGDDAVFRALFDHHPDGVGVFDPDAHLMLFCNPRMGELLGIDPEAAHGVAIADLHPPESHERVFREFGQASRGEIRVSTAIPVLRRDGVVWLADIHSCDVRIEGRRCILGVFHDVTARARTHATLESTLAKYRTVFEAFPVGITVADATGHIVEANPIAESLLGVPVQEQERRDIDGPEWRAIRNDGTPMPPEEFASVRALQERRTVANVEMGLVKPDGTVWLSVTAAPLPGPDGGVVITYDDIGERRRAEAAMNEALLFRREGERIGRIGAWKANPHTNELFWTDGINDLLEAPLDWKPGLEDGLLVYATESIPVLRAALERTIRDGSPFSIEARYTTRSGHDRWAEVRGHRRLEEGGRPFVVGTFQDITDRKGNEEAMAAKNRQVQDALDRLEKSEAMLHLVLESVPVRIFWKDRDLDYLGCNTRFAQDAGFDRPDQIVGKDDFAMGWRDQATIYRADDRAVITSGVSKTNFVEPQTTPDGRTIWLNTSKVPLKHADGTVIGVLGVFEDITERKQAEDAFREIERVQSTLLGNLPGMAYRCLNHPDWPMTFVSEGCTALTGWQPADLLAGRPQFGDLIVPDDRALVWNTVESAIATREPFELRYRITAANGSTRWVWERGRGIFADGGRLLFIEGFITDVTERTLAEDALRRSEAQLRQAQKLDAIGQLAGGVAHDFNNILAAMMMHVGLLQMNPSLDDDTRQALADIEVETNRASALTRQLLMFSRRSVLTVTPLDLNDVVANLLKMLTRLIGEHISLRFEPTSALPLVEADVGLIEQVLMNLVVNARDAMPGGGRLGITTSSVTFDARDMSESTDRRTGAFVRLQVSDTGCGMDAETRRHIFEPFFTTKEAGKGTGLGLATVHGIVAQHRGWVEVQTEPGAGSTFSVYLPVSVTGVTADVFVPQAEPLRGGTETILLVEDEPHVRRMVALTLAALGYHVLEARNGQDAVRQWQAQAAGVQLLLTDMVMPEGMTGLELADRLQQLHPELKVIISSGYSAEIVQAGVPNRPGVVYLPKPYDTTTLARAVRACLDRTT
jgi:PAS domain S-box-containing protein